MATGKAIDNQEAIVAYREIIEAELSCDVIDYGDQPGLRAIHVVARSGDVELTRELLQRHADVNFCTTKGLSPLHYAVLSGSVAMIRLLLVFGAKVNAQSSRDGKTALFSAAERGEMGVARVLLQYGANTKISTKSGKLPRDVAIERADTDLVQMIDDYENRSRSAESMRHSVGNMHYTGDAEYAHDFGAHDFGAHNTRILSNDGNPQSHRINCNGNGNTGAPPIFRLAGISSHGNLLPGLTPPGGEENCNSDAPPSYDQVMEEPSLFLSADHSLGEQLQQPAALFQQADVPLDDLNGDVDDDVEDDVEDDDTTALLGS